MHAPTHPPETAADNPTAHDILNTTMHAPMPPRASEPEPPTIDASVQPSPHAPAPPPTQASAQPDKPATAPPTGPPPRQPRLGARGRAGKPAGQGESMHAPMQPSASGLAVISAVRRGHAERQLAFRVSPEEYKRLDRVAFEISDAFDGRVSKQDIVRLGLQMVLTDHEANGEGSLVTRLAERKLRDL